MWKDSSEVLRTKRVYHLNFVGRQGWVQQQIQGSEEVAIEGHTARGVLGERRPKGKKIISDAKNSLMNQTLV